MNKTFVTASWIALVGFAAGISFFAWTIVSSSRMNVCIMCKRPVHTETRTTVEVGGKRTILCCPTCARMMRERRGKSVEVTEVTDLPTGTGISPREAFVVVGSDVNYCMRNEANINRDKQPLLRMFDSCSPSMLSFRELAEARRFAAEHGGEVVPGETAFAPQPASVGGGMGVN